FPSRRSEWERTFSIGKQFDETLLTAANDLEEIIRIIVQLLSPNLTDGLECLTSLEVMNTIRAQHKIYAFMDMWTTGSTYDLCMKVMHMIVRRMSWDLGDFSIDIWHGFMQELHEFIFNYDWDSYLTRRIVLHGGPDEEGARGKECG
ncbi:hypothetical protein Tco_0866129, partial [Tanacetum coccineum]